MDNQVEHNFWKDKRVLITGNTGFKGSWLSVWLIEMGAEVIGYGLDPYSEKDNYVLSNITEKIVDIRNDVRDMTALSKVFDKYRPEIVFHLAAQPLVRVSYELPKETYEINVLGTLNVLECIKNSTHVKAGIMITTDKCYENKEQIWGYRETDPLGGYDPYSSSKACAEILISSYRNSFMNPREYNKHKKSIASVRAGNVIGGGDWAKERLIPDCIRALENDQPIKIRNPRAIRPWQYVLEPLAGYLLLAQKMYNEPQKYSQSWNFGPEFEMNMTVWNICKMLLEEYGKGELKDVSSKDELYESTLLYLDITKAKTVLGWKPKMNFEKTIQMTVDWYKKYKSMDVYKLCSDNIWEYMSIE